MKQQADQMLGECRILELLAKYGRVRLFGSYELDLMVWPELDIWITNERFQPSMVWEVVQELSHIVSPTVVFVANNVDHSLRIEPRDAVLLDYRFKHRDVHWKCDIGMASHDHHAYMFEINDKIRSQLNPSLQTTIKSIKKAVVRSPLFLNGRWTLTSFTKYARSLDVYVAVLHHGVRTPQEFAEFLWKHRGIDLRNELRQPPGSFSTSVTTERH